MTAAGFSPPAGLHQVVIPVGERFITFNVPITNDLVDEVLHETVTLELYAADNAAVYEGIHRATLYIEDEDHARIQVTAARVPESATTALVSVSRLDPVERDVSLSAEAGKDYTAIPPSPPPLPIKWHGSGTGPAA
jgi:hypothetical protein